MRGGGGGGRRSDANLKENIRLLERMENGIGIYVFNYKEDATPYVGVLAQEVRRLAPSAVYRGRDGYLRVIYEKIGAPFQTYQQWRERGYQALPNAQEVIHVEAR